ncbi:phosphatidate cytidylyltransferase [Sporocytophaga myxococcoides]|uniref:Phosphatidate cytidylyltransferase n=2 Tax=Sporocytophaga myxococcoides TaxID=153721 RepID=A0A098LK78_9BACT|nr:phosphatidate cytidylyltransferase [Sporocytophaga myxococcoides]
MDVMILAGSIIGIFALSEILYHFLKVRTEYTRKFVHISTGIVTLLFPVMLGSHWLVLMLCFSFGVLLIISLRLNFLPSVNAIKRKSVGSIAYPVAVYGSYLIYEYFNQNIYYYLPILILAVCDPIAALTGKRWPLGQYKAGEEYKTIMGSSMFCFSAIIVTITVFSVLNFELNYIYLFTIAIVAAIAEGLSQKGFDNITIPLSVICSMIIIDYLF